MMQYVPQGVCSRMIEFNLIDDTVKDVSFTGGCDGNLKGISHLVEGMNVEDVISRLDGIKCGRKNTSCPDQLAQALKKAIGK